MTLMKCIRDVDLHEFSNWKVGGKATHIFEVNSLEEYKYAREFISNSRVKHLHIGNTTNLLFDNGLIDVGMIRLGSNYDYVSISDDIAEVGAASYCPKVARILQSSGLSGLEHIVGIPATIGGLVYMNGGSKRRTISENIISITSITSQGETIVRSVKDANFSYRKSIYQNLESELIISIKIHLKPTEIDKIRRECLTILRDRRNKFPRKEPSCGSVFISDPKNYELAGPPGAIIESTGLKGARIGGAEISNTHANFIINIGNAQALHILYLVKVINEKVRKKYGFELESEGLFVNKDGTLEPLHMAAKKIRDRYE
ncbi:UDP-N-acetylmuramate dehydrogenase [Vibrio sp. 10N.286.48.F5]|uniref:UDP-N-acetylmuramate dehydrogenase n=1 Tax=Vibrio sp. 10N.286.48.F5 TaxID=3229699 RepID=UPI0035525C33